MIILKSTVNKFTLFGVMFGFLFPIFSTLFQSWIQFGNVFYDSLLQTQMSNPLILVIDSAPFFLGLFARIAGKNQAKVEKIAEDLTEINKQLKAEITKSNSIEKELRNLLQTQQEDIHSAKIIQEFSLPKIPSFQNFEIDYKYYPLNLVGGDMISLTKTQETELNIFVGDVVGHGISAAFITSLVGVLCNRARNLYGQYPREYLKYLNREVMNYLPEDYYLTAMYGRLTYHENQFQYIFSRAGHTYPFVYSAKEKKVNMHEVSGNPIGIFQNSEYEELNVILFPKDKLFIITDGLIEVMNKENKILGFIGFGNIVQEVCRKDLSIQETIESILYKIKVYSQNVPFEDDRTILGIEIC